MDHRAAGIHRSDMRSEIAFIVKASMQHPIIYMRKELMPVDLAMSVTLNYVSYCRTLYSFTICPNMLGHRSSLTNQISLQQPKRLFTQGIMNTPRRGEIERTAMLLLVHISEWKDNFVMPFYCRWSFNFICPELCSSAGVGAKKSHIIGHAR